MYLRLSPYRWEIDEDQYLFLTKNIIKLPNRNIIGKIIEKSRVKPLHTESLQNYEHIVGIRFRLQMVNMFGRYMVKDFKISSIMKLLKEYDTLPCKFFENDPYDIKTFGDIVKYINLDDIKEIEFVVLDIKVFKEDNKMVGLEGKVIYNGKIEDIELEFYASGGGLIKVSLDRMFDYVQMALNMYAIRGKAHIEVEEFEFLYDDVSQPRLVM